MIETDLDSIAGASADFEVVICTRNRPQQLERTLAAVDAQSRRGFRLTVVDQSDEENQALARRAEVDPATALIRDDGCGLSRARNLGWRKATSDWVVFLDDDCVPEPDWTVELDRALSAHPEASFISGRIDGHGMEGEGWLPVAVSHVEIERLWQGRWTRPWRIGLGASFAIRRRAIADLGGFDERLGAGVREFPGGEDTDFNYRLLRAGGVAYTTPRLRVRHEQQRTTEELSRLCGAYMTGWAGFAMKHLRTGDILGGLWLWGLGALDAANMLASAGRTRSRSRLTAALRRLRGLALGTWRGLRGSW